MGLIYINPPIKANSGNICPLRAKQPSVTVGKTLPRGATPPGQCRRVCDLESRDWLGFQSLIISMDVIPIQITLIFCFLSFFS